MIEILRIRECCLIGALAMLLTGCTDVVNPPCAGVICDDENDCTNDVCNQSNGICDFTAVETGSFCDFNGGAGQCAGTTCEDASLCQDAAVRCEDMNECTDNTCNAMDGECVFDPVSDGTQCDFGGNPGVCMSGVCEEAMLCADAMTRCDDGNQCTDDTCAEATGDCTNAARTGFCDSELMGLGPVLADCIMGVCVQRFCDFNNQCDDNRDCTENQCDFFTNRCINPRSPAGTPCNGGTGQCTSTGLCIPVIIIDPPFL